jgi:hypothetical protein
LTGYQVKPESLFPLLRAVLDGRDADALNEADLLLSGAPPAAVLLTMAGLAVQHRTLDEWSADGATRDEASLAIAVARSISSENRAALLSIARDLDSLGEEVSSRAFLLAAGEPLGGLSEYGLRE